MDGERDNIHGFATLLPADRLKLMEIGIESQCENDILPGILTCRM
jgi:hypothetical protein